MRNWTKPAEKSQGVTILLYPQFSNHCLANAVEPLRAANAFLGQAFYSWDFVSLDGKVVESSSGLPVLPSKRLSDHSGNDFLFILASYDMRDHATAETGRALRSAQRRFGTLVGMDTGPWLLAHAGLLNARRATIHPHERIAFSETFADTDVVTDRYVADQSPMTCGGATTAFECVLELLRRNHGEALKLDVAALFLEPNAPAVVPVFGRQMNSPKLAAAVALMTETVENPVPIETVAKAARLSQRSLIRLFQHELGATPQTVYRHIRLIAARDFVRQSSYSIAEIAVRCGYKNTSAMTRAFAQEFGTTPTAMRGMR